MENTKKITIDLNEDVYNKIQEILGFLKYSKLTMASKRELPETETEIINAALFAYMKQMELLFNTHNSGISTNLDEDWKNYKIKNHIKRLMINMKIKQKDLAEATGIDSATLSTILSNKNQPGMENFFKIWTVLGRPPLDDLFYREPV